jgi:hypothetical protein
LGIPAVTQGAAASENQTTTSTPAAVVEATKGMGKRSKVGMIVAACLSVVIFGWQMYCEVHQSAFSPGTALEAIRVWCCDTFRTIGEYIADASSYLLWLNFDVVWRTFVHLFKPLFGILISWMYAPAGYVWAVCTYYNNSATVYVGTLLPLLVLVGVLYWKRQRVSRFLGLDARVTSVARMPWLSKMTIESWFGLLGLFAFITYVAIGVIINHYKEQ